MALTDTDTATTNAALLQRGYEAFASGDIPTGRRDPFRRRPEQGSQSGRQTGRPVHP